MKGCSIAVFGTLHAVQGAQRYKRSRLKDARYRAVLEVLLQGRDFVFEEASGLGPTTAEIRCKELLQPGRYLDVDPAIEDRAARGIMEPTGYEHPANVDQDHFTYREECLDPQGVRERFWLNCIREKEFESGLLICGFLHVLSISFRLVAAGYQVKAFYYLPWDEYCQHADAERA